MLLSNFHKRWSKSKSTLLRFDNYVDEFVYLHNKWLTSKYSDKVNDLSVLRSSQADPRKLKFAIKKWPEGTVLNIYM